MDGWQLIGVIVTLAAILMTPIAVAEVRHKKRARQDAESEAKARIEALELAFLEAGPDQPCMSSWSFGLMGVGICEVPVAANVPHQHRSTNPRCAAEYGEGFGNPWEKEWADKRDAAWLLEAVPETSDVEN